MLILARTPTAQEVERQARDLGLSTGELCEQAGVTRSVFVRWKQGKAITTRSLDKMLAVLTEHAAQQVRQ